MTLPHSAHQQLKKHIFFFFCKLGSVWSSVHTKEDIKTFQSVWYLRVLKVLCIMLLFLCLYNMSGETEKVGKVMHGTRTDCFEQEVLKTHSLYTRYSLKTELGRIVLPVLQLPVYCLKLFLHLCLICRYCAAGAGEVLLEKSILAALKMILCRGF